MPNRQPDWLRNPETKSALPSHHPSTSTITQPDTFKRYRCKRSACKRLPDDAPPVPDLFSRGQAASVFHRLCVE